MTKMSELTHLAALATYGALGARVRIVNSKYSDQPAYEGRIISIDFESETLSIKLPDLRTIGVAASECTLILRPFSDLVEPLPDGTVPLVSIAKMLWDEETDEDAPNWNLAQCTFEGSHCLAQFFTDDSFEEAEETLFVGPDGSGYWESETSNWTINYADIARSLLFAVNIHPS